MPDNPPLQPGQVLVGPLFHEPVRVEVVRPGGSDVWVIGVVGLQTERFRQVNLTTGDMESLRIIETSATYDGDGKLLRLGLQAHSLGIAYEFDPCFGLSVSRVDPLPHQLEAVYDYLLKLPVVRFLDPGRTRRAVHPTHPWREGHAGLRPCRTLRDQNKGAESTREAE